MFPAIFFNFDIEFDTLPSDCYKVEQSKVKSLFVWTAGVLQ